MLAGRIGLSRGPRVFETPDLEQCFSTAGAWRYFYCTGTWIFVKLQNMYINLSHTQWIDKT